MKKVIKQIVLMTGIMAGSFSFISGLLMGLMGFVDPASFGPNEAFGSVIPVFLMCLFNVLVIVWLIHHTNASGIKLGALVFSLIFGVMFFMTQIETIYFNNVIEMPWQIIFITIFSGVVVGLIMAFLSIQYKKKLQVANPQKLSEESPSAKVGSIIIKFIFLALIYLVFYFIFGYYIAWQFPLLREYYTGSTDIVPFISHMQNQLNTDYGLIFFQIFRGFLWAAIGYFVAVNTVSEKKWERYVIVGLALSVGLATPLFAPNDYMPPFVRFGHFFELLIENFLFGVLCALWFKPSSKS